MLCLVLVLLQEKHTTCYVDSVVPDEPRLVSFSGAGSCERKTQFATLGAQSFWDFERLMRGAGLTFMAGPPHGLFLASEKPRTYQHLLRAGFQFSFFDDIQALLGAEYRGAGSCRLVLTSADPLLVWVENGASSAQREQIRKLFAETYQALSTSSELPPQHFQLLETANGRLQPFKLNKEDKQSLNFARNAFDLVGIRELPYRFSENAANRAKYGRIFKEGTHLSIAEKRVLIQVVDEALRAGTNFQLMHELINDISVHGVFNKLLRDNWHLIQTELDKQ